MPRRVYLLYERGRGATIAAMRRWRAQAPLSVRLRLREQTMKRTITLGDYLTEAQLRTLVKDYQVEQKHRATMPYREKKGSRTPKRRQSEELSEIDAIRGRVQYQRHKRQAGTWKNRNPYLSQSEAIARYERVWELSAPLESREQMFAIGQGESTRKKSDIKANAIGGGRGRRGGRIVRRPIIPESSGEPIYRR